MRRAALPARAASNCRLCRYDAIIEPLVRAPNPIREDFIAFLGHIGELADGLKVKQIKADIMAEISNREAEAANYQRIPLSAYILPAKEFLLQDPDWAVALAIGGAVQNNAIGIPDDQCRQCRRTEIVDDQLLLQAKACL